MQLEVLNKGYTYHIYNRGINSTTIFMTDENKRYFLQLLKKYILDKATVYAYCLMNNHFHLLVTVNCEGEVLTQSLSNLFNAYAKAFNKANQRTGSLFEKHFKRISVSNEEYVRQLIVYIHLNPLHHFNLDYKCYKYSSYIACISNNDTDVARKDVIALFGNRDNFIFVHNQKKDILAEKYTLE